MLAWASILVGVKEVCVSVAALGTLIVAYKGLTTWRRELHGRSVYDVVKRLLLASLRVRNAAKDVRRAFISAGEQAQAFKELGIEDSPDAPNRTSQITSAVYQVRLNKLADHCHELKSAELEAEALLGEEVPARLNPIYELLASLRGDVFMFVEHMSGTMRLEGDEGKQMLRDVRKTVYAKEGDEYSEQYKACQQSLESFLRDHMKRP